MGDLKNASTRCARTRSEQTCSRTSKETTDTTDRAVNRICKELRSCVRVVLHAREPATAAPRLSKRACQACDTATRSGQRIAAIREPIMYRAHHRTHPPALPSLIFISLARSRWVEWAFIARSRCRFVCPLDPGAECH